VAAATTTVVRGRQQQHRREILVVGARHLPARDLAFLQVAKINLLYVLFFISQKIQTCSFLCSIR
jgi:hypothetical protein